MQRKLEHKLRIFDPMETGLFSKLVGIRRRLHENPELSFHEYQTSAFLEGQLTELGIPVEKVASTGLIGTLKKGEGRHAKRRDGANDVALVSPQS